MDAKLAEFFTPIYELRKENPSLEIPVHMETRLQPRNALSVFLNKTPLSVLEEGAKSVYEKSPVWRMREIPLHDNKIEFEMTCVLSGVTVSGFSINKKTAKHKAAISYLREVVKKGRHKEFFIPGDTEEEAHKSIDMLAERLEAVKNVVSAENSPTKLNTEEDGIVCAESLTAEGSWTSSLNELLQKHKYQDAVYDFEEETVNTVKKFVCTCTVQKQKTRGKFTNKKVAKNIASQLMLDILKKTIGSMDNEMMLDSDAVDNDFYESIRGTGENVLGLDDAEQTLKNLLSDTHKFSSYEMSYKLPSSSTMGLQQVMLEIITTQAETPEPDDLEVGAEHTQTEDIAKQVKEKERKRAQDNGPFVFCGLGQTKRAAEQNACHSALIHFNA